MLQQVPGPRYLKAKLSLVCCLELRCTAWMACSVLAYQWPMEGLHVIGPFKGCRSCLSASPGLDSSMPISCGAWAVAHAVHQNLLPWTLTSMQPANDPHRQPINPMAAQVKADNPGIAFGDVGKELGARWKALDSDGRAEYEEQAAADKQRYAQEMAAYKSQQGAEEPLG